jgi:MFS family permease
MEADGVKTKKKIRVFAAASFLNDMGSDIIYPVWPFFVTEVLRANMAVLGFLDGLGDALVALSQAASGYFSDRVRRRKVFIWTGYLCGSLSRIGYAVSVAWPQLIPFRMLDRVGKIRNAPRDALVADMTTGENRGRTFGLLRTMDNLGAVCGILLCIALLPLLGYRLLFALAALPSLLGAALVFFLIGEARGSGRRIFRGLSWREVGPGLRLYLLLSAIFALGAFSYSFLLIAAKGLGFRTAVLPALYLAFTAAASLLSLPFGRLSDKLGRKRVLVLSFFLWAAVCAGFLTLHRLVFLPGLFVLYGAHKAALDPVQRTFVSELSPPAFRASCLGAFQMVIGLCALPASLLAGWLWEKAGQSAPFYLSLGLTGVAFVLLLFVKEG